MSESIEHQNLVNMLIEYIINSELCRDTAYILMDLPTSNSNSKPPIVNGYRPDIYIETSRIKIIGEAKTYSDAERKHSINQYKSYMEDCEKSEVDAYFIVSTTWEIQTSIRNMLNHFKKSLGLYKVHVVVISQLTKGDYNAKNSSKSRANYNSQNESVSLSSRSSKCN
jgi:hypothetical protein